MAEEYYSFAEVLRELQIEESELKKLVSEGEINAINNGNSIRFAKSEVDNIRNSRMDAGTMLFRGHDDDDVMLVEDLSESEAISAIEDIGSSVTLEAEFAESSDSSAFVNIDDSGPLLSMNDSSEDNQPILNMSSEIKKSRIKSGKEDTEELIFEQSSGEDLLETGELLFDSVNQVLPRDREEAELFTESEMGISDDYDDIDEASVKAAIDFVDSSDEEPISTSTPKSGINFSASEVQKRQKIKSIAGIGVGLLTCAVVALFFLFPPVVKSNTPKVIAYNVGKVTSQKNYTYNTNVVAVRNTSITTSTSGTVKQILTKNSMVQKDQVVAKIFNENTKLKEEFDALSEKFNKWYDIYKDMKKNAKSYKKAYGEYVKKKKAGEKADLPNEVKKYLTLRRDLPQMQKKLKEMDAQLKKPSEFKITSGVKGVISQVHVKENATVAAKDKLYTIDEIDEVLCSFSIPKGESNHWKKDDTIEVESLNSGKHMAVVENVSENEATQPITLNLHLRIKNKEGKILPGEKVTLAYNREYSVLAVPNSTIFKHENKNYVFVILEDKKKVLKREIQLGEEYPDGNVRVVNNLFENDKIVTDNTLQLEDNQDIVIGEKE